MSETPKASARQRLLTAADELFYSEGVQSVGVDRVIEQADVAKATLYRTFGGKEQLVAAYLRARHDAALTRLAQAIDRESDSRARLLAVFDAQAGWINRRTYGGCPFARATAEPSVGPSVHHEADDYRNDVLALLTELAAEAGAADPATLGLQLSLLYHGIGATPVVAQRRRVTVALRAAAQTLIENAT